MAAMEKTVPSPAAPAVSFAGALGHERADKRIEILQGIARSGSISQAAREAGISYKAAWQALDTLTNLAGVPLVSRAVGGAGGGGASLTVEGRRLLEAAQQVELARAEVLSRFAQGGASGALAQLAVRTSMRNQMPCRVAALQPQGQIVRVQLALPGGALLASRITRESAQLLMLRPGLPVLALCKATAVAVSAGGAAHEPPGRNLLPGRARRVSRGGTGDEVSAELDAGPQLVGFAAPGSGIRAQGRVTLAVDEAAVVVALAG
jgi:molybdate transport system regulatory protein